MTEITIGDVVIKDAEAFLAAHEQLKTDVVALRTDKKELEAKVAAGDEEAVGTWKSRAIRAEAKARLESEGIKDADRVIKRLNLENVDFDENDNLVGFDDSVSEFKADFPELFDKKIRSGGKADIHANGVAEKVKTPTELQAEALMQ